MMASAPFDLIIANIGVSDAMGSTAVRELHREVLAETPVIVVTEQIDLQITELLKSEVSAVLMTS